MTVGPDRPEMAGPSGVAHPQTGVNVVYATRHDASLRKMSSDRGGRLQAPLARIIHECRRESFEAESRRDFWHVRPTQAYWQSTEKAERENPAGAGGSDDVIGTHE